MNETEMMALHGAYSFYVEIDIKQNNDLLKSCD